MTHPFRPVDPGQTDLSPSWKVWRGLLYVAGRRLALWVAGLFLSHGGRRAVHASLVLVGLVVQVVLLCMVAYMVDLTISLFELWAELARKHLEITLSS